MRDVSRLRAFCLFPLPHHCCLLEAGGGINDDPKGTLRVTILAQAASKEAAAGRPFFLPGTLPLLRYARTRRIISWLALGLAGAEVIVGVVATITSPPSAPAGWGGDLTEMFLTVVPLLAVGFALRSSRLAVARTTAVMAMVFAASVSATLLGYLFWGGDWSVFSPRQKIIYSLEMIPPIALYLAAFLVELPAFARRRRPHPPGG